MWAWLVSLQILVPRNPPSPPQAFTIFDSDGNGEIDIGKLSLEMRKNIKMSRHAHVWNYPTLFNLLITVRCNTVQCQPPFLYFNVYILRSSCYDFYLGELGTMMKKLGQELETDQIKVQKG